MKPTLFIVFALLLACFLDHFVEAGEKGDTIIIGGGGGGGGGGYGHGGGHGCGGMGMLVKTGKKKKGDIIVLGGNGGCGGGGGGHKTHYIPIPMYYGHGGGGDHYGGGHDGGHGGYGHYRK